MNYHHFKKIAILQSNYIPWKGYFDLIASVDEFIIYDDVQFTKNDWRNRNIINTSNGPVWLTVPVGKDIKRTIREVKIDSTWNKKHWNLIYQNYKNAPYFEDIALWLKAIYLENEYQTLSQLNRVLIESICNFLNITTKITNSWDYKSKGLRTERLVNICLESNAKEYISGPSAKSYINQQLFVENNIKLTWFNYDNYPIYHQMQEKFIHQVSIIDLLFNCGKSSYLYLKHIKK